MRQSRSYRKSSANSSSIPPDVISKLPILAHRSPTPTRLRRDQASSLRYRPLRRRSACPRRWRRSTVYSRVRSLKYSIGASIAKLKVPLLQHVTPVLRKASVVRVRGRSLESLHVRVRGVWLFQGFVDVRAVRKAVARFCSEALRPPPRMVDRFYQRSRQCFH